MNVYGSLSVYGTKNFMQPHPTDSTKVIKYIAIESGEALTIVRGISKTVNGKITINLPEHFSLVTSDNAPITVLLTPEKAPVLLFVKKKSKENITVALKETDFFEYHDVEFAFQVTGVRDGFEDEKVIINITDKTEQNNISPKRAEYYKKVERIKKIYEKQNSENKNKKK